MIYVLIFISFILVTEFKTGKIGALILIKRTRNLGERNEKDEMKILLDMLV